VSFKLNSYYRKDETGIHLGCTSVGFKGYIIVLYDGYEWDDADGDRILEGDDYYTIQINMLEKILPLIPDEYKNEAILTEYEKANVFYNDDILDDNEKLIFLCILNCHKVGNNFDVFLKILNDNNIKYKHSEMRY